MTKEHFTFSEHLIKPIKDNLVITINKTKTPYNKHKANIALIRAAKAHMDNDTDRNRADATMENLRIRMSDPLSKEVPKQLRSDAKTEKISVYQKMADMS